MSRRKRVYHVPGEVTPLPMTPTEQVLLECVQSLRRTVELLMIRVEQLEQYNKLEQHNKTAADH